MRLGLIGPAATDADALEQAARLLVSDFEADTLVYLADDEALHRFVEAHAPSSGATSIEQRVSEVAASGSPADIENVVRKLRGARYLEKLHVVPPPPTRALEMVDDRIVLLIRSKASIEEEDVINSNVVIYGDAKEPTFKRFGPRCFFSPGPLAAGCVGLLDDRSEAAGVVLRAVDLDGEIRWTEPIQSRGAKVMVAP